MDVFLDLPTWLLVIMAITTEIALIVLVFWVLKKLGVKVFDRFPKSTWIQGFKNAFFTLVILVTIVGGIALIPIVVFNQSFKGGFTISFWVIGAGILCWFHINWFLYRHRAGHLLLDIISMPNRLVFIIMGILSIITGFLGYTDFIWDGTKYSWLISVITGFVVGIYFVIMGFSHIQIRENGILVYVDLIRWAKIESFEWVQGNETLSTLKLRYKGNVPAFLRNGAIPVPFEKKVEVDMLLRLNVLNSQKSA
jgi:hypothetical protein